MGVLSDLSEVEIGGLKSLSVFKTNMTTVKSGSGVFYRVKHTGIYYPIHSRVANIYTAMISST